MPSTGVHQDVRNSSSVFTVISLTAFVAVGILLLPFYRFELSPDAISYLSIASQYASGYWKEAVNAYWGPLYSWSVAVLVILRLPGILASKVVVLSSGILAILGLNRLSVIFDIEERSRRVLLCMGAGLTLAFAMEVDSPDLLFTALLLCYLAIIFDSAYPSSTYSGALCGLLGSLAYLAKSYGFVFFGAHFLLFHVYYWKMEKNPLRLRRLVTHFLSGAAVFLAISCAWISILHAKYGTWMLSTTGDFNHRLVGPQAAGYPQLRSLLPPTSEHATTAWQDPAPSWLPDWHVFSDSFDVKHEFKIIYKNSKQVIRFWAYTSPLFPVLVVGYVAVSLRAPNTRYEWIKPISTIALFSAGYLLITVQDRYFYLADFLLLWMGFRFLDLLFKRYGFPSLPRAVLLSGLALSFVVNPILLLSKHFRTDQNLYTSAEQLKQSGQQIRGRLASCADWRDSAYLAYVLGVPYYGVPMPAPEADEAARELNPDYRAVPAAAADPNRIRAILSAAKIDYFLIWPSCGPIWRATEQTRLKAGNFELIHLSDGRPNDQ